MISIRPFVESDNQHLLEIERLCPQGNNSCAMGVKKTDILARYRIYDNWTVMVAEEDGKVAGWTGLTIKQDLTRKAQCAYLPEVMVHPEFRRKGVASRLIQEAERNAQASDAGYLYCLIYEPNDASKALIRGLGYSHVADIKQVEMSVYRKDELHPGWSFERLRENEVDEAVSLINEYCRSSENFVPFSTESFAGYLKKIPGYGLENFYAARDQGKMVACAGLWDSSTIAEFCYTREPTSWKMLGMALGLLGRFIKVPAIAKEGEYFHFNYLADFAFDRQHPEAMQNLVSHLNNITLEEDIGALVAVVDPGDAIIPLLKKRRPLVETTHVFAKSLGAPTPEFRPFYVDIRDMIL
ncbi:MAG: GNAT family N-acetyltransferase [Methanotrichaceae archaeon]|nr:GNAT family N-acetyltransferase [Methanotrichaceae archaeon]